MSNIVTPLTILSGTFYSIRQLPDVLQYISFANPVFYLIDGFRQGCAGYSEATSWVAIFGLVTTNLLLLGICLRLFATGWRLKP
jgi:ABC-2 type transport system permease protein